MATPRDRRGNYVVIRIHDGVFAYYAHLKKGSIAVTAGQRVQPGQVIAKLGNSGLSARPHLHFGLIDQPDMATPTSLPFVVDAFEITGRITGDEADLKVVPESRSAKRAYPLVRGIATYK